MTRPLGSATMRNPWPVVQLDRAGWLRVAGGVASVGIAVVLFTRFSIDGGLSRDEAIYAYGGQQLSHGVAPYASIFDPKAPLATMLCGLAAAFAHLIGHNDLHMIRLLYFVCSVLTVLAVYVLVTRLAKSVLGGVTAAAVMASYAGFARDALPGPDAKTPGVLLLVICMWLALRRNWFWAGLAGSLAFLVWQPFFIFPLMPMLAAVVMTPRSDGRLRKLAWAAGGAVLPIAATCLYFALAGAFGKFMESAFEYPLTGVKRTNETVFHRIGHIFQVVRDDYGFSGVLFGIGALLLAGLLVRTIVRGRADWRAALSDPLVVVVGLTGLFQFGYALTDFQSYPDVFPMLPYPAIGIGLAVALLHRNVASEATRRGIVAGTAAAVTALSVASAVWFGSAADNNTDLANQRAAGCALQKVIAPGTAFWSLGNPVPLVMTGRRNPDRYIYLVSGVDRWKVEHLTGGFQAWTEQIAAVNPSVVGLSAWDGRWSTPMRDWLISQGYHRWFIGQFGVFLRPATHAYALLQGIRPTRHETKWPLAETGAPAKQQFCGIG
jgi:Dolichyl-phosphate-mannose-protein mannosyltransferase